MEIFYSPYTLTPIKRLNRSSTMEKKDGVLLKARLNGVETYADYFPHVTFGDQGCDHFLMNFKSLSDTYSKKIFHLLKKDQEYQKLPAITFRNHQLWSGTEDYESKIIKYKLLRPDDRLFMDPLLRGFRIRLDANAMFNRDGFLEFIASLPASHLHQIDYIEDPINDGSWENLPLPVAADVTQGSPHDVYIYRPNCEFFPANEPKVIFSSYLGHDFGRWHAYCELTERADLSYVHGIISKGFFKEENFFYDGSYETGFRPNQDKIRDLYQHLAQQSWKKLCEI